MHRLRSSGYDAQNHFGKKPETEKIKKWGFWMDVLGWIAQLTLLVLCVMASAWDLRWRRIPDWLILVGLVTGLFLHLADSLAGEAAEAGNVWMTLADAFGGLLAGGLPWLAADLFGRRISGKRSIGGGDMKFYAMCGVFLGLEGVLLSYCVLALVSVFVLGTLCLCRLIKRKDKIPFAPLIAVAVMITGVIGL